MLIIWSYRLYWCIEKYKSLAVSEAFSQEIATGRVPFSEIRTGPAVTMAVSRDRRIPEVAELRTSPSSPKTAIMLSTMLSCWKYEAKDRITAEIAKVLVGLQFQSRDI